jgi:7-carboxy-7-deazaguanine synthase
LLTINEIYISLQGESTYTGVPCVFVRLTACDLRCSWCDTPYAFHEGRKMSVDDVVSQVEAFNCPLVEITGGEPLLQRDVYELMEALLAREKTVLLETGGHLSVERVPPAVVKIMDIKCPGSGECARNEWTNIDRLTARDEVKFVIKDRDDYEFARDVVNTRGLQGRVHEVLFSPVHGVLDPKMLAGWVLEDKLPVRMQVQLHKYVWGAEVRGV